MKECIFHSVKHPGEYLKYLCHADESAGRLPLVVFLPGAGSRGDDLALLKGGVAINYAAQGKLPPCIMVMPQCKGVSWFEHFEVLLEFIDHHRHDARVDIDRVYLCGNSMGGYAAWNMACLRPDWFAALVPVCGGGMPWLTYQLKTLPIWAFHGMQDTTVLPEESLHMVKAVNANGGNAKLTLYPHAAHDAWTPAFTDDDMWAWLFAQRKQQD